MKFPNIFKKKEKKISPQHEKLLKDHEEGKILKIEECKKNE